MHHEARVHLAAGRAAPALRLLSEHLANHAEDASAWDDAAEALLRLGQPDAAVAAAREAARRTGNPEQAALVAVALAAAGRTDDALDEVDALIADPPSAPRAWERLARTFEALGRADAGVEARAEAHRLAPGDAGVALRLAERLEKVDRRDEARALVASLGPAADRLRVRLDHHDGRLDDAAAVARRLLEAEPGNVGLWMELGRIEARRKQAGAAFAAAARGNELALREWVADGGDVEQLPRALDALLRTPLPPSPIARTSGAAFVIGFPRSGTTLVQQILAAHPGTRPLEELPLLDGALAEVLPGAPLAEVVGRLADPAVGERIRAAWWGRVRARVGVDGRLIIDKLPLNLLRVDVIARAFPGAPIVTVLRDPRDAVLSAFLQDFELNTAMAQCADIERCARLYARAFDLWLRARDGLPRAIELRYEDLVRDPEPTLRPVLSVLGLPWDDAVLHHTDVARDAAIGTPSYRDVRRPLHAGAVGRWRAYAELLAPALPILQPYVRAFGYED